MRGLEELGIPLVFRPYVGYTAGTDLRAERPEQQATGDFYARERASC